MTRRNGTRKPVRTTVAALCLVCAPLLSGPSSVSGFKTCTTSYRTTVANNLQSVSTTTSSGLFVSISPGSTQATEMNNDPSSFSSSSSRTTTTKQQSSRTNSAESGGKEDPIVDWDWKAVVQEIWRMDTREIILFDGECNLCNGGVNMLLDMDTNNVFRFCSLSSNFGKSLLIAHGKNPEDRDNIMMVSPILDNNNPETKGNNDEVVVVEVQSKYLQKSEAVMSIARKLEGAPKWVKAMTKVGTVAKPELMDWLLEIVANNRHRVNVGEEYDQCRLDFDGEYDGRFLNDYDHPHLFGDSVN